MTSTLLNRSVVIVKTNKSGGAHAQGDVCIEDTGNANSVVNDTSGAYKDGVIWVCIEPAGVPDDGQGLYACGGFVPKINLDGSAALGDFIKTSTTTKKGTPHAAPAVAGDFAQVLGTGTSPAATLFTVNQGGTGGGGGANYDSIIPTMLSASWRGFTVSATENYSACPPRYAFNPDLGISGAGNGWLSNGGSLPIFLKVALPVAVVATAYAIVPWSADNFPGRTPATWTFQGSHDNSSWTTLDTQTSFSAWTAFEGVLFTFSNSTAWEYYRINISANGGNAYVGIALLEIYP